MNAFLLLVPILLLRYGLLSIISKEALKRASFFAPLKGREKIAFWIYQFATILIFIYLLLLKIKIGTVWFYIGLVIYSIGVVLFTISIISYVMPKANGINMNGLYQLSRNPMYVSYFVYFLGCVILTNSWILLALLIVFQISSHWIILSEERWCIENFGEEYKKYMNRVRRYI